MENQIKYLQNIFYDLLNDYERVFLLVKYSEKTTIGSRGFTDEEKEKGLILIFNNRNHKSLQWTEDGSIVAALGFGVSNRIENNVIPRPDRGIQILTPSTDEPHLIFFTASISM